MSEPGPAAILLRPSGELELAFSNLLTLLRSRPWDALPEKEIVRLEAYLRKELSPSSVAAMPDFVAMGMCMLVAILTDPSVSSWARTHPTYPAHAAVFDLARGWLHEFMYQCGGASQKRTVTQFFVDVVVLLEACQPP